MNQEMYNAIDAARKLIEANDRLPHFLSKEPMCVSFLDEFDISAESYLAAALMLREACIAAPAMDIAGIVLMADHYKARGLAQKAFVHMVRCRPDFAEVARRSGLRM